MNSAIIYTWPPDYLMASYAARCLQSIGVRPVLAIDHKDPRLVVGGVEIIRTDFPRGGNLNGKEFVCGHLDLMQQISTGPLTLKVDSDTLLMRWPQIFDAPDAVAMGIYVRQMEGMNGSCYALRTDALAALREAAESLKAGIWYLEDRTIGELALACGPVNFPVQGVDATRYTTWRPEKAQPPKWYRGAADVVIFPRLKGHDRPQIERAMKPFFP